MQHLAQILFIVGLAVWLAWVLSRRYLNPDLKADRQGKPISDEQIRREISEMRQDLSMLAVTNFAILLVLVFSLVLRL